VRYIKRNTISSPFIMAFVGTARGKGVEDHVMKREVPTFPKWFDGRLLHERRGFEYE
jgi:hypothetical protein